MFEKHIKLLQNVDWEYIDYSDKTLISLINQFTEEISEFEILELCLWDFENEDVCIGVTIRSSETQRLNFSKIIYVHKVNDMDEQKELDAFKKEAYRIKRILKSKYPKIRVISNFNWQGMK